MTTDNVTPIRPPAGADLEQCERLEMAASYLERSMQRIAVCAAALTSRTPTTARDFREIASATAQILEGDVHNDIGVAREIFLAWKAEEVANG